jgi:Tol biopolymer transport system component/DNA-binding winged helix-turn-helix (wHTH) protein
MLSRPQLPNRIAFGPFTVDAAANELLKGGLRIRLPGQPFQILLTLLERPGEVVSREQLREKIWLEGTFVDFEHGLNAAINKLRRALGDSADNPRYIETIPNRGYRFIGRLDEQPSRLEQQPSLSGIHALEPHAHEPAIVESTAEPSRILWPYWSMAAVVVAALVIAGAVVLLRGGDAVAPPPAVQFVVTPPPGAIFSPPIARKSFAISPDGTRLAFIATGSAHPGIWVRDLSSVDPRPLPGTEGAWSLFWSPDSQSIFYSEKRAIKEANLESNSTRTVAALPAMAMHGTWRSKDNLLLYLSPTWSYEVATQTGANRLLPKTDMRWAQFLPDSDNFIHVVYDPVLAHYRAVATTFKTLQSVSLMETDSRVEYAPPRNANEPGYLLFLRGGSLLAQPFDAARLRLTGQAFPLVQNVTHFSPSATACFSVSNNGVLVYQIGSPSSELRWYDRGGRMVSTASHSAPFNGSLRISPDGESVAAELWNTESGGADIWVFGRNGRESRRLTYPPFVHTRAVWSPDGRRVVFGSSRTGAPQLATLNSDGSGTEQPMVSEPEPGQAPSDQIQVPTDWSRDGRFIVFDDSLGEEERAVWLLDVATHKIMPLLQNGSSHWGGAFSPDGHQIAFISDESGRPEAYLQGFEALPTPHLTGSRKQISHDSAWLVRWRPDGKEIFYVGLDARLYAGQIAKPVAGTNGVTGLVGEAKPLFQIPGNPQSGTSSDFQFDVSGDGQQFAMTTIASTAPPNFIVIQNWQTRFHH